MEFDAYHHLLTLSQQGWTIQYQRYSNVQGVDVPTKILLKNGELRAVIVISTWDWS
jgi:outer membrane lipoprotein LolB